MGNALAGTRTNRLAVRAPDLPTTSFATTAQGPSDTRRQTRGVAGRRLGRVDPARGAQQQQ
eukprot:5054852-Lingulodinium_polyedra.AAC.1